MANPPAISPHTVAAHVFVESVAEPVLDDADRHHLERVLRLRPGTAITVADGAGRWRPVGLGTELEPLGPVVVEAAATPRLTVAFAIVKGDRPELIARALTEIGVDRLVPMATVRGVVRWSGDRGREAVERLRRVVRSAGMQSRRVWLPDVADVADVAEMAGGGASGGAPGSQKVWPQPPSVARRRRCAGRPCSSDPRAVGRRRSCRLDSRWSDWVRTCSVPRPPPSPLEPCWWRPEADHKAPDRLR